MKYVPKTGKLPWRGQAGVTGLETAIVLIAFVVVSSVFAFAALSTGLFSADKSKVTIHAGLSEARGSLEVKGGLILRAAITADTTAIGVVTQADGDHKLLTIPVLPGSEQIVSGGTGNTPLTVGSDYSINYDTGRITLVNAGSSPGATLTADYSTYSVESTDINLANAAGGDAVLLTAGETIVVYQDRDSAPTNITDFTITQQGAADSDNLIEEGEVFTINVDLSTFGLTNNDDFTIQIKPPTGPVILLGRRVPNGIDEKMLIE